MLILLFSGCSYKFAKSTSNLLKIGSLFIIIFFYFFFILKILGIDITELLIISRINEYLHIISNSSSYERYIFLIGMRERISFGNPTAMCTLLWMVISIEALFKESKINLAKLFFPITFITSSRTFIIVMSFYYLGKLKFSITKNLKIIFILIPIFIIIFINIDWNEISQIILNIARIEDFNIQTILIKKNPEDFLLYFCFYRHPKIFIFRRGSWIFL